MFRSLSLLALPVILIGCSSPSVLEGKVVDSKPLGQGVTEHIIQTNDKQIPIFILRTNKHNLHTGCEVALELP
jgi:hypothetical protein